MIESAVNIEVFNGQTLIKNIPRVNSMNYADFSDDLAGQLLSDGVIVNTSKFFYQNNDSGRILCSDTEKTFLQLIADSATYTLTLRTLPKSTGNPGDSIEDWQNRVQSENDEADEHRRQGGGQLPRGRGAPTRQLPSQLHGGRGAARLPRRGLPSQLHGGRGAAQGRGRGVRGMRSVVYECLHMLNSRLTLLERPFTQT